MFKPSVTGRVIELSTFCKNKIKLPDNDSEHYDQVVNGINLTSSILAYVLSILGFRVDGPTAQGQ